MNYAPEECGQQGARLVEKKTFLEVADLEDEIQAAQWNRRRRYRSMPAFDGSNASLEECDDEVRQHPVLLGSRSVALDHTADCGRCRVGSPTPSMEDAEDGATPYKLREPATSTSQTFRKESALHAARRASSRGRRVSFASAAPEPAPEPSDDSPQVSRSRHNFNTEDLQDFFEMRAACKAQGMESHLQFSDQLPTQPGLPLQRIDEKVSQQRTEMAPEAHYQVPCGMTAPPRVASPANMHAPGAAYTLDPFSDVEGAAGALPSYSLPPEIALSSPVAGAAEWHAAFAQAHQALHLRQYASLIGVAPATSAPPPGFSAPQQSTLPAMPMLPPPVSTWPSYAVPVPYPVPVPIGYSQANFVPGKWPFGPLAAPDQTAPAQTAPEKIAYSAGSLADMLPPPTPMLPPTISAALQEAHGTVVASGPALDLPSMSRATADPAMMPSQQRQEAFLPPRRPGPVRPTTEQPLASNVSSEQSSEAVAEFRIAAAEPKARSARRAPRLWVHIYLHMKAPDFDLVPMLIGRGGCNMRKIAEQTESKIRIRGQGSGHKEIDGTQEAPTPLMVAVTTNHTDYQHFKEAIRLTLKELSTASRRYIAHCDKHGYPHEAPYYSVGLLPTGMEDQFRDVFDGVPFASTVLRNSGGRPAASSTN